MHFRPIPLLALHLCPRRLGLRQPEGHVHGAVEVQSGRECGAGLLPLANRGIQHTEATVAVGLERAHAECFGQGQGLLVVGFGVRDIGGIGVGMDDAKLVQRERLAPAFLALPG